MQGLDIELGEGGVGEGGRSANPLHEKKLKKEQTTDPKLTVMQETDTNPNDTQSADSERLTLDQLQEYKVHPNMRY